MEFVFFFLKTIPVKSVPRASSGRPPRLRFNISESLSGELLGDTAGAARLRERDRQLVAEGDPEGYKAPLAACLFSIHIPSANTQTHTT